MSKFPAVAIVGSREFPHKEMIESFVYSLPKHWTIVSGGARGVDSWAIETAEYHHRHTMVFIAEWHKYGRSAGFIRNNKIVRNCDVVVAFWDGSSKGTRHTIQLSKNLGRPCIVVRTNHD